MSRIRRTRRSTVDTTSIWAYIAERNFPAADARVMRIDATLQLLADNPFMGEAVPDLRAGVRRFTLGNYLLYFEPMGDGIRLLRVVHAARQIDDLFD
jgi:toxin ParE1/3/4